MPNNTAWPEGWSAPRFDYINSDVGKGWMCESDDHCGVYLDHEGFLSVNSPIARVWQAVPAIVIAVLFATANAAGFEGAPS